MTQLEEIRAMKNLLSNPKNWTKGSMARNQYDWPISPTDDLADKWCLEGACRKVRNVTLGNLYADGLFLLIRDKSISLYNFSPWMVNDELGHDAVMRVLRSIEADLVKEEENEHSAV